MRIQCVECGTQVLESFGSAKGGDIVEAAAGRRLATDIRVLCGICATFYANVRWPGIIRPPWVRLPIPTRKLCGRLSRLTGISFLRL